MAWAERFNDLMDPYLSNNFKPEHTSRSRQSLGKQGGTSNRSRGRGRGPYGLAIKSENKTSFPVQDSLNISTSGFGTINNISSRMQTVSIIGVVIAREGPKVITLKKGTGNEKHLVTLTVRDAPMSFINVSCWGGPEYAKHIDSITSIGDVVEIKEAQVQSKSNPADDKFKPWTPNSCQLSVGENHGCVLPSSSNDMTDYAQLVYLPPRAGNDFHTLEDIQASGMNFQEEHVNIMAIVKKIWPRKSITTKKGRKTSKMGVILCDETCLSFDLTLWDSFVDIAERWVPMETNTPEANILDQFRKNQSAFMASGIEDLGIFSCGSQDPDVESITNVLTIQNAIDIQSDPNYHGKTAYGVVYACLSSFDVDSDDQVCVRNVCPSCWRTVQKESGFICTNANCLGSDPLLNARKGLEYNISVSLSDHSGTLNFCHLQPILAKELIGYEAHDFAGLTTFQRTAIKWNVLFERVKAVLKIKGGDGKNVKKFINVLTMTKKLPDDTM